MKEGWGNMTKGGSNLQVIMAAGVERSAEMTLGQKRGVVVIVVVGEG